MSGKPMDAERLDSMREHMARGTVVVDYFDARALLADRDHQEAEAKRTKMSRDASDGVYLRALARAFLAADPMCPANADGSGEWALEDVAEAVDELATEHAAALAYQNRATRELAEANARCKRWRSQCPVKAEHVEAAGVTRADALAWAHANCWAMSMHPTVHGFIEAVVSVGGYVAFEVLDEMATATPGGDQ